MTENDEKMFQELDAIMEKYGIIDFFYCGISLEGLDYSSISVGDDGISNSNRARKRNLLGAIEIGKQQVIKAIDDGDEDDE